MEDIPGNEFRVNPRGIASTRDRGEVWQRRLEGGCRSWTTTQGMRGSRQGPGHPIGHLQARDRVK